MMRLSAGRPIAGLGPMLLLAACASWNGPECACAPRDLQHRFQARLMPDIAAGRATLQTLPDGVRVALPEASLFADGGTGLDDSGRFVLARVIEGLFDPRIMRLQVADSSSVSPSVQDARARSVVGYFDEARVGPVSTSTAPPQPVLPEATGMPSGDLIITARIVPD